MHKVLICGAGKIGETIASLLTASKRYNVTLADADSVRASAVAAAYPGSTSAPMSMKDSAGLAALIAKHDAVISALPFYCNVDLARAARDAGKHYFDLTEDVETTRAVAELSKGAKSGFMPQCGLAPGFISIAARSLCNEFQSIDHVKLRVGALPMFPSNRARYNLTWSTEGLINEYGNLCEAVVNGAKVMIQPLEGYETFLLNGQEFEAFNTSGGLGTLCKTLAGKAKNIDYKSIRYIGHREYIAFLMNDLGFNEDRESLKKIFERSIPTTPQDRVVIRAQVIGQRNGKLTELTYASIIPHQIIGDRHFTAIQVTTAAGVCAPLDMLLSGHLKQSSGFIKCEEISLTDFLKNEFGKLYLDEAALVNVG